jgi:endonuclease III
MWRRPSRARVRWIVEGLYREYGTSRLDNKDDPLEELVFISLARQKVAWIKGQLERIRERFGRFSLKGRKKLPNDEVERFLCSLPGVQIKAVRCVMMYTLGRDVLPADTHVLRVSERLVLLKPGLSSRAAHKALDARALERTK